MRRKIFITRRIPEEGLSLLRSRYDVEMNEEERQLSRGEMIDRVRDCDGLVCLLSEKIDREVLEAAVKVKVISNFAVGYDNIDIEAATELGIVVCNTPGVLTNTVADLVWALMLGVARRIVESDDFVRGGRFKGWEPMLMRGYDIYGKTLGIIGMGRIGKAVAERARGFSMRVLYYDIDRLNDEEEKLLNAHYCSLDELLSQSDFISLHVPLTRKTSKLIGRDEFCLMKRTAIFVNTSRGQVVDEEALVEALRERIIAGAGLDVFEKEPEIHPGLLNLSNVILLPHIGSATVETRSKMAVIIAENIINTLDGRKHNNIVNVEVWDCRRV